MKKLLLLLPLTFLPLPAQAITWEEFWRPFTPERVYIYERPTPMCDRPFYYEKYVPGDRWNPGYVKRWTVWRRVPCYSEYDSY